MYILLNSPKSFRHQGLENEKWLLLLPDFAQDPEPPHVSDFPGRLTHLFHRPWAEDQEAMFNPLQQSQKTETYKN